MLSEEKAVNCLQISLQICVYGLYKQCIGNYEQKLEENWACSFQDFCSYLKSCYAEVNKWSLAFVYFQIC